MKLPKIKLKKIWSFLGGAAKILARKSFLTFSVFFLLVLLLGGFIFYKYSFLAENSKIELKEKPLFLKKNVYNNILQIWQEREKRFQEAGSKDRIDPFFLPSSETATSAKLTQ